MAEQQRLGVRQAAERFGIPSNKLYVAAAKRLLPAKVLPGGRLQFKPADVQAFVTQETIRRAKREQEKQDAAVRIAELMAKQRAKERS